MPSIGSVPLAIGSIRWDAFVGCVDVGRPTYFNWRSKYGGVAVSELKRMKDLESENAKLKRMYADLALENTAIKDVLSRKL